MSFHQPSKFMTYICFALIIGCSGGTSGTGARDTGNDVAIGTLKSVDSNSITLNGVSFNTVNTSVSIDGNNANASDLEPGMILDVTGSIDDNGVTGVADIISVVELVKGVVQSSNGVDSIVVMAQEIQIAADTVLDKQGLNASITVADIMEGDSVEISGHIKSTGVISATRVEVKIDPLMTNKVIGLIGDVDTGAMTLTIGSLTVNYMDAVFSDVSKMMLASGMMIEVKGVGFNGALNILTATNVEQSVANKTDAPTMKMEGFVTDLTSTSEFILNSVPVIVEATAVYRGGIAADIMVGVELEVEGALIDGILYADEVEFEDSIRIEAVLASVDLATGQILLAGLDGFSSDYILQTQTFTEYDSNSSLSALVVGNTVRIRGNLDDMAMLISITRIDDRGRREDVFLQGPVSQIVAEEILILGEVIDTTDFMGSKFKINNVSTDRAGFYSELAVGSIVKASGVMTAADNAPTWKSVEIN